MEKINFGRLIFLLGVYFLLIIGFVPQLGFYSFAGTVIVFFVWLALLGEGFNIYRFPALSKRTFIFFLKIFLILNIGLFFVFYGGLYQEVEILIKTSRFLIGMAFLTSLGLFIKRKNNFIFSFLVLIAFLLKILMIFSSPAPKIDVFEILKTGSLKLIRERKNPYSITFKKVYKEINPDYFPYLPGILLMVSPIVLLFDDPRFVYVIGDILLCFFILKLLRKEKIVGRLLVLLYLYFPTSLFLLEQSWVEPVVLLLIFLTFYFFSFDNSKSWVFLGMVMVIKQIFIIFPLFLKKFLLFSWEKILKSLLVMGIIILPFLLWDFQNFWNDVIFYHLNFNRSSAPFQNALNLKVFLEKNFNIFLAKESWLIFSLSALFLPLLFFKKNKTQNTKGFFVSLAFGYLGFFFFSFQAFFNYYYFVACLLLFEVIASVFSFKKSKNSSSFENKI